MYFILTYLPFIAGGGYLAIIGSNMSFNFLVFIFSDLPLNTFTAVSIAL